MVAGVGDLGRRLGNSLARHGGIDRLILAGRRPEVVRAYTDQLRIIAALSGGPAVVRFEQVDLDDRAQTAGMLQRVRPDVLVLTASRATWWRPLTADPIRACQLSALPYGAWLPIHVSLVRRVMEANREADVKTRVISLPFPDAVGPALAPLGLAPHIGAGNVAEVAAKLQVLAAAEFVASPSDVIVRLVMHHASERIAFDAFTGLSGDRVDVSEPPWLGEVAVRGRRVPDEWVDPAFRTPYPLPPGPESQEMTAAAAVQVVTALLAEEPRLLNAPAPEGLPGGYPVLVNRTGIKLHLPQDITREAAIAINRRAGRWDGIAAIESDGTVVFTTAVTDATEGILGLRLDRVTPGDMETVAAEMMQQAVKG